MIRIGKYKTSYWNIALIALFAFFTALTPSAVIIIYLTLYTAITVIQAIERRADEVVVETAKTMNDILQESDGKKIVAQFPEIERQSNRLLDFSRTQLRCVTWEQSLWGIYMLVLVIDMMGLPIKAWTETGFSWMFVLSALLTLGIGFVAVYFFRKGIERISTAADVYQLRKDKLGMMLQHIDAARNSGLVGAVYESQPIALDDESNKIMEARMKFSNQYASDKGWDVNDLTFEQIKEIRDQDDWKTPRT